jgi:hypothetical protein
MTTFPLAFLSRYERDADLMHDVAVKAQPLFQKYTFEKRGTEAVAERFVLSGPRGSAKTLAEAQSISALRKNSNYFRFLVPQGEYNGSILIPHKDIAQSEADPEAGAKALEDNVDRGTANVAAQFIQLMLGPAGGNVGTATFHSAASGAFLTFCLRFVSVPSAARLQEGDHVVISTADGSGSSDVTVGSTGVVIDRDIDNGYVRIAATTDTSTAANPGGWDDTGATTYYVFRLSELAAGDGSDIVVPWASYVPPTRQTSTLLGVDRSSDSALSGARLLSTESKGTLSSRAKKLVSKMRARLGTDANRVGRRQSLVLYAEEWATFEEELTARLLREPETKTRDGYEAFVIGTVMGELDVISEPYMQQGYGRIISTSMCRLITTNGKLMRIVNEDGNIISRMPNSNDMEMRPVIYAAHVVGPPHAHGIFPTA